MKLPVLDKLRAEDFTDAPEWFTRVMVVYNKFVEIVYLILNKRLNVNDNFNMQIFKDRINQSGINNGYRIKHSLSTVPEGVTLIKIIKVGGSHTIITTAPYVDWTLENDLIRIHGIAGIASDSEYDITLKIE